MRIMIIDTSGFTRGWSYSIVDNGVITCKGKIELKEDIATEVLTIAANNKVDSIDMVGNEKVYNPIMKEIKNNKEYEDILGGIKNE